MFMQGQLNLVFEEFAAGLARKFQAASSHSY